MKSPPQKSFDGEERCEAAVCPSLLLKAAPMPQSMNRPPDYGPDKASS